MSEISIDPDQPIPSKRSSLDYSGISILAGNAFTIVLALWQKWDLAPLLAIYWAQSVTIGVFHFFRMMKLRQFSTEGFTSNNRPVPRNEKGKRSTAWFFAMHYGFFHLIYAIFLFVGTVADSGDAAAAASDMPEVGRSLLTWVWMLLCVIGFIGSHAFSFVKNVEEDLQHCPNIGIMMFLPYLRIIPMHLTIILGGGMYADSGRLILLFFLLLKTLADYFFHIVEHRILRKERKQ